MFIQEIKRSVAGKAPVNIGVFSDGPRISFCKDGIHIKPTQQIIEGGQVKNIITFVGWPKLDVCLCVIGVSWGMHVRTVNGQQAKPFIKRQMLKRSGKSTEQMFKCKRFYFVSLLNKSG